MTVQLCVHRSQRTAWPLPASPRSTQHLCLLGNICPSFHSPASSPKPSSSPPFPISALTTIYYFYIHTHTYLSVFLIICLCPQTAIPMRTDPSFYHHRTPKNWPRAWHTVSLYQSVLNEQINPILMAWLYVCFCPELGTPQSRSQLWFISGFRNRLGAGGAEAVGLWRRL